MATRAARFPSLDLPSPFRAAAPLAALAVAAALFDVDPRLPWLVGVLAGGCFALAAAVRAARARLELAAVRRTADRLIVYAPRSHDASPLVLWRCRELTSEDARAAFRRELERTLRALDPEKLPGASPLRRAAARRHEPLLRAVADRIGDDKPVSARGILLARELLRSPASPLYAENAEAELGRTLSRILGALEP